MSTFRHFLQNAGRSGVIRTVLVAILMVFLAIKGGGAWHLLGIGASTILGGLLGNWMAGDPEARHRWLRGLGLILVVSGMAAGALRDTVSVDEGLALAAVLAAICFYMGAYVRFMSHPNVMIEE